MYPDRSGVYLQCHAVSTAATLLPMQCTCSIGCSYTADTLQTAVYTVPTLTAFLYTAHTLPARGSVPAVYVQPTLQLHWNYTACTLHFGLGNDNTTLSPQHTTRNPVTDDPAKVMATRYQMSLVDNLLPKAFMQRKCRTPSVTLLCNSQKWQKVSDVCCSSP